MSKEKPLLSFCIPTYNRGEIIERTIKHIISYKSSNIEIIVSDNCSEDNTESLIKKLNDSRIKYYKNNRNYGITFNIVKSLERGSGEYLFLLSDEDSVQLEAIPKIIKIIELNRDASVFLGTVIKQNNSVYMQYENQTFSKGQIALWEVGFTHHYMSGIIYKREKIDFDILYSELNKESNGLMDVYPHVFIVNLCCYEGDVVTIKDTIVSLRDMGENYVEELHDSAYVEPASRFIQFKKNILFVNNINEDNTFKIKFFIKLLNQHLYSISNYEKVINDQNLRSYYKLKYEKFNFNKYSMKLKKEVKELLLGYELKEFLYKKALKRAIRTINNYKNRRALNRLYYDMLKINNTPMHSLFKNIYKSVKTVFLF